MAAIASSKWQQSRKMRFIFILNPKLQYIVRVSNTVLGFISVNCGAGLGAEMFKLFRQSGCGALAVNFELSLKPLNSKL